MSKQYAISRRGFVDLAGKAAIGGAAAVAVGGRSLSGARDEDRRKRPNVILIMTDDQGYGDLGCHGNDKIKTPNLDRFAAESTEFNQFYVCPVCAPTRACLMTGRYNYRTGVVDTWLGRAMMHGDEVTMAELFGAAGYRTGIFGKWHLGDNYPLRPNDQGFQEALVHMGGGIGQPSDPPETDYFDPILQHNGQWEKHKGYCTDIFATAAIRFIDQNRDRPFFCYLPTNAPHTPLKIADEYVAPYKAMGLDETTAKVYGMVTNIDDNMGKLLHRLKELDLEEDTIVIFLTDNGPQQARYTAGLRGRKGTVYEGGIRVPFFIRWPGRFAVKAVDRIAAHIDILPTLMDICDVKKPDDLKLDGRSLRPLLRDSKVAWRDRTLFFQWHRGDEPEPFRACAARNQQYKLVNGKELYDISADPNEESDIAAKHPDIVDRMRREYMNWFRDVSSTRGYAPPRIHLGTPYENPTILTRQDWRGPRASWGPKGLGHWEVKVAQTGRYGLRLRFRAPKKPAKAHFQFAGVSVDLPVEKGATDCTFKPVTLEAGDGRVEAWIDTDGEAVGVMYVDVKRMK